MAEKWQDEKVFLLEQTRNYLMALANKEQSLLLIESITNIRTRAMSANKEEWKAGGYWKWWQLIRPSFYA